MPEQGASVAIAASVGAADGNDIQPLAPPTGLRQSLWRRAGRALLQRLNPLAFVPPVGEAGIAQLGHRGYVGGLWEEMGQLQLAFLIDQGLEPHHRLLDIACGSLRLGVKAIAYLDAGNYIGVEKEARLIELALKCELDREIYQQKRPLLLVDADFGFERIGGSIDRAIAQSLFSHLPAPEIQRCLAKLRPCLQPDGVMYATFFESVRSVRNPTSPHDHYHFRYTRDAMLAFGSQLGYQARYIGAWGHPRGQVMVEYRPC